MPKNKTKSKVKTKSRANYTYQLSTIHLIIFGLIFAGLGAIVAQSFAAPPNKGGTGTISAPIMVADSNADGVPNWNERVRFTVSTTATTQPYVNLKCTVDGVSVYDAYEGYFTTALDDGIFTLASNGWTAGAADCTATLVKYQTKGKSNWAPIASTSFRVNP